MKISEFKIDLEKLVAAVRNHKPRWRAFSDSYGSSPDLWHITRSAYRVYISGIPGRKTALAIWVWKDCVPGTVVQGWDYHRREPSKTLGGWDSDGRFDKVSRDTVHVTWNMVRQDDDTENKE